MIKYYSFIEVTKKKIKNKRLIHKNHKFLYESVNSEIKYYIDNETEKEYINYFDRVLFEIIKTNFKPDSKNYNFFACHIYKKDSDDKDIDISNLEISKKLRNSKTLTIDATNSYDTDHLKVVYSETGFAFIAKEYEEQIDMFEKNYILYLLAHAYNLYTEKLIEEISLCYKENNFERMLELRKEIYIFDLNCFFINPVNYQRQQLHTLWGYLQKNYLVDEKHKEMKSQAKDLVNLIELQYREDEKKEREVQKEKEQIRYREAQEVKEKEKRDEDKRYREKKDNEEARYKELQNQREEESKQFNKKAEKLTKITIVIAVLSLLSLIGAYKDLKDLEGTEYIYEKYQAFEKLDKLKYINEVFSSYTKK